MADAVLALNAGSSSIEFVLFETDGRALASVLSGAVDGIGTAPRFAARDTQGATLVDRPLGDQSTTHEAMLGGLLDWVDQHLRGDTLIGVGHRVVHGGPHHERPVVVTEPLLAELDPLIPTAPVDDSDVIPPHAAA